jgi:sugar/nucleoside kinase (ribokinase family)
MPRFQQGGAMTRFKVYAMGAALVDTEIRVDDTLLGALGVEKGLMTLVDEQRRGELLGALDGHLVEASHASGGSAGNSVIATALFGGPCYMSCRVADDEDGRIYLRDLDAAGIRYPRPAGDGTPTGKCLVLVTPDAERSMNTFLGASEQLSTEQLDEEAIARSDFLYLEGYLVTSDSGRAAAIRAREIAQAQGVPVALSFSDPGIVAHFRDGLEAMLGDGIDLLFSNDAEALGWTGAASLDEAVAGLRRVARRFAITRGGEGALLFDGQETQAIDAHRVEAVDSNGAGDMFAGAFLYALTRGETFATAGRFASLAAGTVVSQWGPRLPREQYAQLRDAFFGA